MRKFIFGLLFVSLTGVGCLDLGIRTNMVPPVPARPMPAYDQEESVIDLPLKENVVSYLIVRKGFGMYVEDRFRGYHVGLDIEIPTAKLPSEEAKVIPVTAIADGTVLAVEQTSGYGGVIVIKHQVELLQPTAVYGHVDFSSARFAVGNMVKKGDVIAFLGEDETNETDGERQHLHFALYDDYESPNSPVYIQGYESRALNVDNWINPLDFFREFGQTFQWREKNFSEFVGDYPTSVSDQYPIDFVYPENWSVEYIPSLNAINVYDLYGEGTARERSQIFIRSFDADQFLTLSTVQIYSTEDQTVGAEKYVARRYDIEKKQDVPDFTDQPSWRNIRHTVTDFRAKEGKTRYYVIAANPELDSEIYEQILKTMEIQ